MIAEFLSIDLFHLCNAFHNLSHDLVVDLSTVFIILCAGFSSDSEALRYRQTDLGHFSKVGTLAAKQLTHAGIAFRKQIYPFCHVQNPSCIFRH